MREILFRGKSIKTGEWVYGDLYATGETPMIVKDGTTNDIDNFVVVDKDTIGQYTGFDDINNNKIFDNDICKFIIFHKNREEISTGQVFYDECAWLITDEPKSVSKCKCYTDLGMFKGGWSGHVTPSSVIEVIGNIFVNPELLEVK